MTFPRLVAVAESAWTPAKSKECSLFMQKLPYFLQFLGEKGIYYFNPFNPESTPEPDAPDKDDAHYLHRISIGLEGNRYDVRKIPRQNILSLN